MHPVHSHEAGVPEGPVRPTDETLAQRFRAGDEAAWEELLARHSDLLDRQAKRLAHSAAPRSREDRVDEASEIYLFLAELVRHSLASFSSRCRVRTWIGAVVGNRAHILKAWLRRKDPSRAEVRLPAVLRHRPAVEQTIYRHLVWGLDPRRVALELGVPETLCRDVEDLLAQHSPRVVQRIRANRLARSAPVRLATGDDDEPHTVEVAHPGRDPYQDLVDGQLEGIVVDELDAGLRALDRLPRRLLCLLYERGMSVSDVVRLAAAGQPGLTGLDDANRCYYMKDRALRTLGDRIVERLRAAGHRPEPAGRRPVLRGIEDLLRTRGVPMEPLRPCEG